jgi:hypothetical protein
MNYLMYSQPLKADRTFPPPIKCAEFESDSRLPAHPYYKTPPKTHLPRNRDLERLAIARSEKEYDMLINVRYL